jgi:cytochrome c peroxidase
MKMPATARLVAAVVILTGLLAWAGTLPSDTELLANAKVFFQPLPKEMPKADNPLSNAKVELGKMLYFEPRLSKSGAISCNSCHNIATYGVDNLPTSIGHKWAIGDVNAPTTMNAAGTVAQFWDGRAKDVEEQAKGPVLNPKEMGIPHEQFAVDRIASIPEYQELFKKAFPDQPSPLTYDNMANAIGAFERTLITPGRFDKFLEGDTAALTQKEKEGLNAFLERGCTGCHFGPAVGGTEFDKFGIYKPYQELTGSTKLDEGRFDVTKNDADRFMFKVPVLRNVSRTYPYFHDGTVWNLKDATKIMGEAQLDEEIPEPELEALVAFLNSLTGEIPKDALQLPVLPPSTDQTSRPDVN